MEPHGASHPERDRRREIDGRVPDTIVGKRHRRRAYRSGHGAEIPVPTSRATDSAELAGGQLARASNERAGARFLLPDHRFEQGHLGRHFSGRATEGLKNERSSVSGGGTSRR